MEEVNIFSIKDGLNKADMFVQTGNYDEANRIESDGTSLYIEVLVI